MAAPAQHSTTDSLTRYADARSPVEDPYGRPNDFCNSFWGPGDDGVNILLSRMRGAAKTTDELRNFWNERCVNSSDSNLDILSDFPVIRAAIEDQYATRLATLAKSTLGSDEIGCVARYNS